MFLRAIAVSGVVAACGAAATAWAAQAPAAASVDVSGQWRLNEALSSGLTTDAAPGPAPDKNVPKGVQKAESAPGSETKAPGEKKPTELTVTQTATEVTLVENPGGSRSYWPNGKTYKADEGQSDIRSSWQGGRLVFEKKNAQGWKLTETWSLSADRNRLTIDQVFEGGHRPKAVVKRVYDRVAAR